MSKTLKERREDAGLTVYQFADNCEVPASTVVRWETVNTPTLIDYVRIVNAYGINERESEDILEAPTEATPDERKEIGARVRSLREYRGMSIEKFADELDVKPSEVMEFEDGESPIYLDSLSAISKALGYSTMEIIGTTGE